MAKLLVGGKLSNKALYYRGESFYLDTKDIYFFAVGDHYDPSLRLSFNMPPVLKDYPSSRLLYTDNIFKDSIMKYFSTELNKCLNTELIEYSEHGAQVIDEEENLQILDFDADGEFIKLLLDNDLIADHLNEVEDYEEVC